MALSNVSDSLSQRCATTVAVPSEPAENIPLSRLICGTEKVTVIEVDLPQDPPAAGGPTEMLLTNPKKLVQQDERHKNQQTLFPGTWIGHTFIEERSDEFKRELLGLSG